MRYLPHTPVTRKNMLNEIQRTHIDELFTDVPPSAQISDLLDLPLHQSEWAVEQYFQKLSQDNHHAGDGPHFLGAGAYRHHVPAAVDYLIQRGEFLTSYTPYQPEISQGTLQYLFEFQTQVALLTGMDVANASMYDGATATVEAVMMANRLTKRERVVLTGGIHPHYVETIETYGRFTGFQVTCLPTKPGENHANADILFSICSENASSDANALADISCIVVQYPDFFGTIQDLQNLADACHEHGILLIVIVTEIIALGFIQSPGHMGADVVVGDGQSLGCGLNFGGPTVGLFATRQAYLRQMPGRIAGQTVDANGKRGWVLTLSTREQHIRREKATSNICTNAGLCALAFTIHASLLGEVGLQRLAKLNHYRAIELKEKLQKNLGFSVKNALFFNEFVIELPVPAAPIVEKLATQKILAGFPLSRFYDELPCHLLLATTETTTSAHIDELIDALIPALQEYL